MLTRRHVNLLLVASVAAFHRSEARAENTAVFSAYAMRTTWHPIPSIGDWPLDHTAVAVSNGDEYGCFGRKQSEEPDNARLVARGRGDFAWAKEIAGRDEIHAGIDYGVTGICNQCANRILLPANIDVRNAFGNEIATPIFGTYGLGQDALIKRVEDAAFAVNQQFPGRIPDETIHEVVARISGGLNGEWEILHADMERFLKPALGEQYDKYKTDIEDVYQSLYYKRVALYDAYSNGRIDKPRFIARMNQGFASALDDLHDVMGDDAFRKIVPVPPGVAADYVFYNLPAQYR